MENTLVELDAVHATLLSVSDAQRAINNILTREDGGISASLAYVRNGDSEQSVLDLDEHAREGVEQDDSFIRIFHKSEPVRSPLHVDWNDVRAKAERAADTAATAVSVAGRLTLGGILKLDAMCGTLIENARSQMNTLISRTPSVALEPALAAMPLIQATAAHNVREHSVPVHVQRVYDAPVSETSAAISYCTTRIPVQGRNISRPYAIPIRFTPLASFAPVTAIVMPPQSSHTAEPAANRESPERGADTAMVYAVALVLLGKKLLKGIR